MIPQNDYTQVRSARPARTALCETFFAALVFVTGCASGESSSIPIDPVEREGIRKNLVAMGARVTSDSDDGLYLSLRNTFIEIHAAGGMVEGSNKTQQDLKDFANVNAAVAKVFLAAEDSQQFNNWLRAYMASGNRTPQQSDCRRLKATISRVPLHLVFSLTQAA